MSDSPTMLRDALRATATAIVIDAPDLARALRALLRKPVLEQSVTAHADACPESNDLCALDLPPESLSGVHAALQRLRERDGNDGKFRGYEINYLLLLWQRAMQAK